MNEDNPTQNRPDQWSLADEGFDNITRLDYYGQPYRVWERRKNINLGKAWQMFREMQQATEDHSKITNEYKIIQASTDLHDEQQQLDADRWNEKIEQYEIQQLLDHEKKY